MRKSGVGGTNDRLASLYVSPISYEYSNCQNPTNAGENLVISQLLHDLEGPHTRLGHLYARVLSGPHTGITDTPRHHDTESIWRLASGC